MDSAEATHLLDYYAKYYQSGMVDLSASSPTACEERDGSMDYAPPGGLPAIREAIAAMYPGLSAEHVEVTNGAAEALAATAFALVRPGNRVSAGEELYPSFRELAVRLGAVLSSTDASLVVINNSTIPDGRLIELRPLAEPIEAAGAGLVADEVYLDLRAEAPIQPLRAALRLVSLETCNGEALVVLAKATAPGLGKTRLANEINADAAAELARAFLRDTIDLSRMSGRDVTIAFTPSEARPEFSSTAPEATLVEQPEGDLGDRIGAALIAGLQGRASAVLIGSDTPQLSLEVIDAAFRGLQRANLVVGPASDGGFYLIGITESSAIVGLFEGIQWSTSEVCRQLIENARRLDHTVELLQEFTDIDDAKSLAAVLCQAAVLESAPSTRAAASRLGLEFA